VSAWARFSPAFSLARTNPATMSASSSNVSPVKDGRLVSLAREASDQARQVLGGLARAGRARDLTREIAALDEREFFEFLAHSTEDLSQLCRVIDATRGSLASSLLDRLLVAATFKAGQQLGADRVTLFLLDSDARKLRSRVAQSDDSEMLSIEVSLDEGIAGHVARTGGIVNLADAYASPHFNPEVDQRTGYRTQAVLCIPLKDESGLVFAVAQALNKQGGTAFSDEDVRRFETFLQPLGRLLQQVLAIERLVPALHRWSGNEENRTRV
jgi:GAF domain-containing protein